MNIWLVGKDLIKHHYQIKKYFYSELYLEDITDKRLKNLGDDHDLHVQSHTLLLADVFENFKKIVLKYMNLILLIFFSEPVLAWHAA